MTMPAEGTQEYEDLAVETGGGSTLPSFNYDAHISATTGGNESDTSGPSEGSGSGEGSGSSGNSNFVVVLENPPSEMPTPGTLQWAQLEEEIGGSILEMGEGWSYEGHILATRGPSAYSDLGNRMEAHELAFNMWGGGSESEVKGSWTADGWIDWTEEANDLIRQLEDGPFDPDIPPWEYIPYDPLKIAEDVVSQWFSQSAANSKVMDLTDPRYLQITASSWSESIRLVSVGQAATAGDRVDATQIDFGEGWQGSVLNGADNGDVVWGRAGWDVLDGADGNDLLRAGNGRDILIGGPGEDELHGDFGWNTYRSEVDGYSDLIAIKSDEHMIEGYSGTAGHNPNGEKCDIIEGLDSNDEIIIIGVESNEITVRNNASAHGETGIGIYADGALEGLYTGGDLSVSQIRRMTTGVLEIEPHGFRAEWDAIV